MEPGDPLRDRPRDELLTVATAAIAEGRRLDQHSIGAPVDVDGLDAEQAAETLLREARWPAGIS